MPEEDDDVKEVEATTEDISADDKLSAILKIEKLSLATFQPVGTCEDFQVYSELLNSLKAEVSMFVDLSKNAEASKARVAWRIGRAIMETTGIGMNAEAPEGSISQLSRDSGVNRQTLQKALLVAKQYETPEALERMISNFMLDKRTSFNALAQLLVVRDDDIREGLLEQAASGGMTTKQARRALSTVYDVKPEALSEGSRKKRDAGAKKKEEEEADGGSSAPQQEATPADKMCRTLGKLAATLSTANDHLADAVIAEGDFHSYDRASREKIRAQLQSVYDMGDSLKSGLTSLLPRLKRAIASKD